MSPARRSSRRRDWPRGLYEPRPNYYVWRHPDGTTMPIGRVPLAVARNEAIAANQYVADQKPGLVERLSGASRTVADLLAELPESEVRSTRNYYRCLDKIITESIGKTPCGRLTVADCDTALAPLVKAGKLRQAQSVRSRLVAMCRKGMQKGWMESNPAEVTDVPKVKVQRARLTLDQFKAIYAKASEVNEWLQIAMQLALLTGADRSTIAGLQRSAIGDGYLTITRPKTKAKVAIPLAIRLETMGWTLADAVAHRTSVVSRHLVHHVNPWGNAKAGSAVRLDSITKAFTTARELAGIPDDGAPTFHEIRSLCKRLYDQQGNVDTKALLGHATERMSALYADPRGVEPIRVRVTSRGENDDGRTAQR